MNEEKKYSKEEIQELENKKDDIECILRKHYLEEKLQQIRNNKEYVGKCYIDNFGKRYIKIISQYGDSTSCVTGLCVNCNGKLLTYDVAFDNFHSRYPSVYSTEELFYTDDVYLGELSKMTEVGTEEFDRAMDIAYEQFKVAVNEFANNVEKMISQWDKEMTKIQIYDRCS